MTSPHIVAIDEETMRLIDTKAGDIVEVHGDQKKTLAKVMALRPADSGKQMARIDEDTRGEAQIEVGDRVVIRRSASIPTATKVILIPLNLIPAFDEQYLPQELDGTPLTKGSHIAIRFYGERLLFKVVDIIFENPSPSSIGKVNGKTEFALKPELH